MRNFVGALFSSLLRCQC